MIPNQESQAQEAKATKEAHHDAPLREEEKLTDIADFLEQSAKASKSRLSIGEGTRVVTPEPESATGQEQGQTGPV